MGPGGLWWSNVLDSALPPWRLSPDIQPKHQNPASHTAGKKSKKKKKKKNRQNPKTNGKSKTKLTKSPKETYTHTLTERK